MLNMRVDHLVETVVDQFLYGKGREDEALHFAFDVSMSYYTDTKTFSVRRGLQLLYYALPHSNTIHVFSARTEKPFTSSKEVNKWKHQVSHDSCWRGTSDNRAFANTYFEMANDVNQLLTESGFEEVAPIKMIEHNFCYGNLFDWVKVKMSKDPNDNHGYRKLIEVI